MLRGMEKQVNLTSDGIALRPNDFAPLTLVFSGSGAWLACGTRAWTRSGLPRAGPYFEKPFEPPDAWLNAATSRRLCSASFSSTLCT